MSSPGISPPTPLPGRGVIRFRRTTEGDQEGGFCHSTGKHVEHRRQGLCCSMVLADAKSAAADISKHPLSLLENCGLSPIIRAGGAG